MLSGMNPFKLNTSLDPNANMEGRKNAILKMGEGFIWKYEDKNIFSPLAFDILQKLLRFDP